MHPTTYSYSLENLHRRGPDMWVDEALWGHRLHDEQTPWLAFLEFLNVLRSEHDAGCAFKEPVDAPNTLSYQPYQRLHLRNILFNNPWLDAAPPGMQDNEKRWAWWLERMTQNAGGLDHYPNAASSFDYLRSRFTHFEDFAYIVRLLQSSAIEEKSNKRWTSKFVFPYGADALYEDLNVKPSSVTNDRRFFGRVGELVYLMLCRSGHGEELIESLRPIFLSEETLWNRVVRALSPQGADRQSPPRENAYLPYANLPEFKQLAQDWLALLRCEFPGYDVVPHLVDMLGLHVVLYKLRRAQAWAAPDHPLHIVLEIVAPKRTTVRDLAARTYLENNQISGEAIKAYIRQTVEMSPEWQAALTNPDSYGEALETLQQKVGWPDPDKYHGPHTPEGLLHSASGLYEAAKKRHDGHVAHVHTRYMRAIGLVSRRGTNRLRYTPNDRILKTLVLSVVPGRLEYQQFLQTLYDRYRLVIGHRQAAAYIEEGQSDQKTFEDNARRLERRLASLGLLRRLSDACAYVENPYIIKEEP